MNELDVNYHKESIAISSIFGMFIVLTYFVFIAIIEEIIQKDIGGIIVMICLALPFVIFVDYHTYKSIKGRMEYLDALVATGEEVEK